MKVMNLLPFAFLCALLLFLAGWSFLGWSLTSTLPYMISLLVLFIASLAWHMTRTQPLKKINALVLILLTLVSICLIFRFTGLDLVWEFLVLSLMLVIQLFLGDISKRFKNYTGLSALLLYLPLLLTAWGAIALFGWNGSLLPAWIGLPVSVVISLFSLLTGTDKTVSRRRR